MSISMTLSDLEGRDA